MLIPLKDIVCIYQKIFKEINISDLSVIIYTGVDIDSLCTLKILSKCFKSDSIQFKAYPVTNYSQLQQKIQQSKGYQRVKLFIFINCGGFIDLSQKWFTHKQQSSVFLFDVNKPINHKNIQSQKIMVIDDEHSQFQYRVTSQDLGKLQQLQELDIDQMEVEEEEDEEAGQSHKRNSRRQLHKKLKKHKEFLQKKVFNYYGRTFFSLPSSYCAYKMASYLNKANNYYLWLGIVSLTSMYLENNITKEQLDLVSQFYKSQMVRFNQPNLQKKQKGEIFSKMGYQFTLMNHWSLYESMIYSPYLMIKLSLWNDKGVYKMEEFLTNIGISMTQAKSLFKFMSKQSKDSLQQNIFKCSDNYKLHEIMFQSFMKQTDFSTSYMASDFHYILTAILQKSMANASLQQLSQHRIGCFWQAYGVIDGSQQMLKNAVQQCKTMFKLIMKEVRDIVQRDNIMSLSTVSFANIRCDTKQKRIFQHPYTLIRLAYLLMGIQKQKQRQRKKYKETTQQGAKPFIASLQDTQKNLCTIVGVMGEQKNNLGNRFNEVAMKLGIEVKHDNFIANIMIIPKQNLLQFIKQLGNTSN